jgi:Co/Zn/Cd efflux system component
MYAIFLEMNSLSSIEDILTSIEVILAWIVITISVEQVNGRSEPCISRCNSVIYFPAICELLTSRCKPLGVAAGLENRLPQTGSGRKRVAC